MNNLECAIAVLAKHREARQWADDVVAADLVAQLGLDPQGNAKNAIPVVEEGADQAEEATTDTSTTRRGRAAS